MYLQYSVSYAAPQNPLSRRMLRLNPVAKFLVPTGGFYRLWHMSESTIFPSQGLRIWLEDYGDNGICNQML
jgi:hypothetical protein